MLDLEGVELTPEIAQLPSRVQPTDPYIAGIRFGKKAPNVLRVVLDLKADVKPEVFALPAGRASTATAWCSTSIR